MTNFRILKALNDERLRPFAGSPASIGPRFASIFPGDTLVERLVRSLGDEAALPQKEVAEAFEFFGVTRKYLKHSAVVADLCSGHGLAGLLFAVFERRTERVLLCDRRQPAGFERALSACVRIAPWVAPKVTYLEGPLARTRTELPPGCTVLGVHACGKLTDTCLEIALELGSPVAVLPCCRAKAQNPAPEGLRQALGEDVAYDVDRTYRMERRGYRVRWREIPAAITPMNRVLIALQRPAPTRTEGDLRSSMT